MILYLRQPIDEQQTAEEYFITLNKKLIHSYCKQCDTKWSNYPPKDYYYYQYLLHHAIQAEDDENILTIMKDFKWMNAKLKLDNTIYHLCTDITKAIDCLRNKNIKVFYFVSINISSSILFSN